MVLNNYWKWVNGMNKWNLFTSTGQGNGQIANIGMVDIGGNERSTVVSRYNYSTIDSVIDNNRRFNVGLACRIGTGDNEYDANDYALASDVTSSFSGVTATVSSQVDDGLNRTIMVSGSNNTSSDITITEIGIAKNLYYATDGSSSNCLFAIAKLDTPITVPANSGGFTATFEWVEG